MSTLDNVALTPAATDKVRALRQRLGFAEATDAIRLGVAVALRERLNPGAPEGTSYNGMNFRTDGLDPDGHLRLAIQHVYPDDDGDPDVVLRVLMSRGTEFLADGFEDGSFQTLADVLDQHAQ